MPTYGGRKTPSGSKRKRVLSPERAAHHLHRLAPCGVFDAHEVLLSRLNQVARRAHRSVTREAPADAPQAFKGSRLVGGHALDSTRYSLTLSVLTSPVSRLTSHVHCLTSHDLTFHVLSPTVIVRSMMRGLLSPFHLAAARRLIRGTLLMPHLCPAVPEPAMPSRPREHRPGIERAHFPDCT